MTKTIKLVSFILLLALVTAWPFVLNKPTHQDLIEYIDSVKKRPKGQIEPLFSMPAKASKTLNFQRDPFVDATPQEFTEEANVTIATSTDQNIKTALIKLGDNTFYQVQVGQKIKNGKIRIVSIHANDVDIETYLNSEWQPSRIKRIK